MNKLDAFNNDKTKCKKCKEYFDYNYLYLCENCFKKWKVYYEPLKTKLIGDFYHDYYESACFKEFLNEKQT